MKREQNLKKKRKIMKISDYQLILLLILFLFERTEMIFSSTLLQTQTNQLYTHHIFLLFQKRQLKNYSQQNSQQPLKSIFNKNIIERLRNNCQDNKDCVDQQYQIHYSNSLHTKQFFPYLLYIKIMNIFKSCLETAQIVCNPFEENAILTGVSDTIIVKQKDGKYKSTPFLVCFGPYRFSHHNQPIQIIINNSPIEQIKFTLDYKGYIHPQYLSDKQIRKLRLNFGMNKVIYQLEHSKIQAQIYLYADNDKLVVSDVDGTVTKNDIGGHVNNFFDWDYLHQGYADLAKGIDKHGYKIVWLTMRALPLYNYSKNYLRATVGVDGPIMMEPQQLLPALSKELMKKTGNIKANMMNLLKDLFPSNPFMAGLGNRQNDAVAYLHAGTPLDKIFIVDTKSRVQIMNEGSSFITYKQMHQNIEKYFPTYFAPKVGYM